MYKVGGGEPIFENYEEAVTVRDELMFKGTMYMIVPVPVKEISNDTGRES